MTSIILRVFFFKSPLPSHRGVPSEKSSAPQQLQPHFGDAHIDEVVASTNGAMATLALAAPSEQLQLREAAVAPEARASNFFVCDW